MSDPARYAGRDKLVREAYGYLKNRRSLFITGRRGVGKSSLAAQLQNLLTKSGPAEDRFNLRHEWSEPDTINVVYRCVGSETLKDLAERLLSGLSRETGQEVEIDTKSTSTTKIDLKLFAFEQQDEVSHSAPDIVTKFSQVLTTWCRRHSVRGPQPVVFWIDEVDLVIDRLELGVFIKVVLENLSDSAVHDVSFVLVGITHSLGMLKSQHQSITRFVMPMYVPPMTEDELAEIVDRALAPTEVRLALEVKQAMHLMSQGFPDPIHSIGYELFEAAMATGRSEVSFGMFEAALRKIITVVKKEEFHSVEAEIPDDRCERALFALAQAPSEYSTPTGLSGRLGWPEPECRALCLKLVSLRFLEQEGRKGFRFSDPLFRVYLSMQDIQREADIERAKMLTRLHVAQLDIEGGPRSGALSRETENALFDIILKNYRRSGRSGIWDPETT